MEDLFTGILLLMPTYSYSCNKCKTDFELFFSIKDYVERPKCSNCGSGSTNRLVAKDAATLNASVKKSDSELKTIGDLASRNRDRMSNDQKRDLSEKHNSYKKNKIETKHLPKGMKYIKKPPKPIWPK